MLSPWMDQVVLLGGTEQDSHDDLPRKIYDYGAKGSRLHFVPDVLKTRAAHDWIIGASGGGNLPPRRCGVTTGHPKSHFTHWRIAR